MSELHESVVFLGGGGGGGGGGDGGLFPYIYIGLFSLSLLCTFHMYSLGKKKRSGENERKWKIPT